MNPSNTCESLIKGFEKFEYAAYLDPNNIPTIAWGHTRDVKMGDVCTIEQGEQWFREDIAESVDVVNNHVTAPLNQNQFDALVSFCYNVGPGKKGVKPGFVVRADGTQSTILKLINDQSYAMASVQFGRWIRSGGVVLNGLIRRRKAESDLWNTPTEQVTA